MKTKRFLLGWSLCAVTWSLLAYQNVSGTITTDTTWGRTAPATDGIYRVTGTVTVQNGATLTIEPGVIVKFNLFQALVVGTTSSGGGTLAAVGTEGLPIVFTSIRDDVGGDTNGDGGATTPAKGDWSRIAFASTGSGTLAFCDIRYGGYLNKPMVDMTSGGGPFSLSNCAFEDAYAWPLATLPTLASTVDTSNSFTDNKNNGIWLGGQTPAAGSYEIPAQSVPWFLDDTFTLNSGVSLSIAPGTVIKIRISKNPLAVSGGSLQADGDASHPIVFTSIKDDSAGGDTNGDGNSTAPARGDWGAFPSLRAGPARFATATSDTEAICARPWWRPQTEGR